MPLYPFECLSCGHVFDLMRLISERDDVAPCPKCQDENTHRKVVSPNVNFSGDGWASKNGRVQGQMAARRRELAARENEMKRDGAVPSLVPNVDGEQVGSWREAKNLAASKGKDTASYDAKIAETARKV